MAISKSQALQDMEWAIGINRLCLQIVGNDMSTDSGTGWRKAVSKWRIIMFFVSVVVLSLVPQTVALMRMWGHLLLMMDNLIVYINLIVIECELVVLWYKNDEIAMMVEHMRKDWMRPKSQQERNVMLRYGKLSRTITIGGYVIIAATLISYHLPVAFGFVLRELSNLTDFGDRPFVMPTIYFFDAYRSPVYEIIVLTQLVVCTICVVVYTTVGTLFSALILHVGAQFENLYNRIVEMGRGNGIGNFQDEFNSNIKEHLRLIRFSGMIESTFSLMLVEVVIGFTLHVCLQGYYIIVSYGADIERPYIHLVVSICYIMYMTFIMLVYMGVGDVLVTQSAKIQYATYNCKWYKLKPQEAVQLIPILVRSQRPLIITAGKLMYLNLPTFATLMKTTAGYISFLLAVKD